MTKVDCRLDLGSVQNMFLRGLLNTPSPPQVRFPAGSLYEFCGGFWVAADILALFNIFVWDLI